MEQIFEKSLQAAEYIRNIISCDPEFCFVTGSGLDNHVHRYNIIDTIPYTDVPHMKHSTFHKGHFLHCEHKGIHFLILRGRLHYYEGYSAKEVTFAIRILSQLGVKRLLLTNASGGLNPEFENGELVMLNDHINLFPEHPLRGPNDERFGERFPDMSDPYDHDFRKRILGIAESQGIKLEQGVYAGFQGPSMETPAEYKFLHIIGADMVGMSTVPEVIVANHCSMKTAAISIVTNVCYPPERIKPTTVEDVINTANKATPGLYAIVDRLINP
ncbi:MAG: purine-nucleoside phosphorylase [Saprospiraceae bacterium]|nr:purine-nucleoside phosphorylase [Saprospiraceae bacterium]